MNQKPLVKMSKEEREEAKRRLAYLVRQIQNEKDAKKETLKEINKTIKDLEKQAIDLAVVLAEEF